MKHRRWILTPLMALLFLLLVAPAALAAPPVDGWQTTSLSEDVGQGVHARMDGGHVVWVDGRTPAATPIVLLDVATGQREVIAPDGSSPEIAGDHIAYLGPGESSSSGRAGRDVFLYEISSGETRRLTNDAKTRFNYRLSVQGDMVTWLSATRVGIEGPMAGDMSLLLHNIAKNQTATLAAGEPGTGGPSFYVSDAEKVIWRNEPAWTPGEPDLEVWFYSVATGETREIPSLRDYNIAALAGDVLLAWRQWSTEGGVEHLVTCDLDSGQLLPLDEQLNGATPDNSLVADGSSFAWPGYADGSTYVALSDLATGQTKRISTTGYDVGGPSLPS